ncbi:tyrosine-type recombinase/integrase [Candidatus Microthrix sp.]|uniref:tyrosine-type recombinase/integrase n=1 Tax=Candidatus Neomicrothrix sp. TaxID=2719034 RepID=UPI0025B7DF8F|nr:site-specific integrase [Candidatus Microthrix sp.]
MRGSLRRLPSGSWEIRLFLGTDDTGKKRYRSKSVKGSKREAERTMRQLIAEIEAGRAEANRSEQTLTIDQLLERWQAANVNDWSPTTARDHQRTAEGWISPHIGTVRINRLTVERLEGFYQTLLSEGGKAGRPLSAQSVKKAHSILRAALSAAVRWRLIPNNPALIAHTPRVEPHQHKVPDLDTVAAIIGKADPRMATIIRLAIATGARRGELGALKWSDIDVEQRLITFQRSVVDGGPASKVKPTKTRTTGVVSVGEATMASIEEWRAHQTDAASKVGLGSLGADGWVFPSRDWNHPLTLNQITNDWRTLADAHGLDGVRFHDLRHATATHLIANGTDVRTVAGRLRHASPTMTLDVYAARTTEADQAAGELSTPSSTSRKRPLTGNAPPSHNTSRGSHGIPSFVPSKRRFGLQGSGLAAWNV